MAGNYSVWGKETRFQKHCHLSVYERARHVLNAKSMEKHHIWENKQYYLKHLFLMF